MNVSYDWLRALVPFDESPTQLRDLITARVATVDDVIPLRQDLAPIVVARVVEAATHPDSDHLHVTRVDAGTGELLDVVCGAPNVTAGKLYPFAPTGTTMPNGLRIERRKIRGAVSNGMLCSARELGLGQDHEGILELQLDVPPGTPFLQAMPVGDTQLVIDVLPNRPDLLSHLGVAREIAAATGRALALPLVGNAVDVPMPKRVRRAGRTDSIAVHVEETSLAPRYMGAVVRDVKVGPSPEWLARRIESVGGRSINNVVDATNYVLHELGQPIHAFDLSRLGQATVVVRRARPGEKLVTLDGVQRTLDADVTVIADAVRPHAVAGVMGGLESEVTEQTTDIFLEVAVFDPASTRRARRKLGLSTDASYRFERGVDPQQSPLALERLVQIILNVAGGALAGEPVDVYAGEPMPTPLALRSSRVERVLGDPVGADECARLLHSIGFIADPEDGGLAVRALPPSWRPDVTHEIDLIEEVARLRGYDSFSDDLRPQRPGLVPDSPDWLTARRVRETLVGAGLLEVRAMPFVAGGDEGYVRVANPLAENEAYLRRSILETLARRAEYNLSHMHRDIRLFEIGAVFAPGESGEPMPSEELRVAALIMGRRHPAHFSDDKSEAAQRRMLFDEWDAKWLGELTAGAAFPGRAVKLEPAGGEALWVVKVDGVGRGVVTRVALDAPVWAGPAFGVELALSVVSSAPVAPPGENAYQSVAGLPAVAERPAHTYHPLPTTPPAEFDLALLVPSEVTAAQVADVIERAAGDLLERLELLDLYAGAGIDAGHRSLAWRLVLRAADRTLSGKEIEGRRRKILGALEAQLHVQQRTA